MIEIAPKAARQSRTHLARFALAIVSVAGLAASPTAGALTAQTITFISIADQPCQGNDSLLSQYVIFFGSIEFRVGDFRQHLHLSENAFGVKSNGGAS
ncbi:MAG TPA: hypothetical protein VF798_01190 [Burkholderiaceae bacterium]